MPLRRRDTARVAFLISALLPIVCPAPASAQTLPAFNWMREVDNSGLAYTLFAGSQTDAQGNVYVVGSTQSASFPVVSAVQNSLAKVGSYDVFLTKFGPAGNILYSTYFGGSADDIARAMAVDAAGDVYVAGTTASTDFPTTPGSWSPSPPAPPAPTGAPNSAYQGAIFLFRLNPDGSVGYSTYFTSQYSPTDPKAIAVDATGSAYLTGISYGGVPTTAGVYQTNCACGQVGGQPGSIAPPEFISDAFLARFDSSGSKLIYSTYLGVGNASGNSLAVGTDSSAYVGSPTGVYRLDAGGSSLLASVGPVVNATAMMAGPDGRIYLAGQPGTGQYQFQPTAGAFQTAIPGPTLPGSGPYASPIGIAILDATLQHTIVATYFGVYGDLTALAMALDAAGNIYVGGGTKVGGLPTSTPLQLGFGGSLATGFVAELSGDLSTLLFSSYFGDGEFFQVSGLGVGTNGAISLAGATGHGTVWANSVQPASPLPALRIDSVANAASQLGVPISPGETIIVRGAGFDSDAQFSSARF